MKRGVSSGQVFGGILILVIAVIGSYLMIATHATGVFIKRDPEFGKSDGCVQTVADDVASGNKVIAFASGGGCNSPSADAGAHFPIDYDVASLPSAAHYVATDGSDSNGGGSTAPYATLAAAYAASASGDTIVVRGGQYHQGNLKITPSKPVHIVAYPGETPVFDGAVQLTGDWTDDGTFKYHDYTPMPVTDGSGVLFTQGKGLLGDGAGKFPDQIWIGTSKLDQVTSQSAVADGKFYVDSVHNRVYLTPHDAAADDIEASDIRTALIIAAPGTEVHGIRFERFSNTASDLGVIKLLPTADNTSMQDVEVDDASFISITLSGSDDNGGDILSGVRLNHITVDGSNWMGINATYTDNLTIDKLKARNLNSFNEFDFSPQSGAVKTSRTRYTKVLNSSITHNNSHGFWFDQSNVDVDVANNWMDDNTGTGVFFEISDDLLLINNYIHASGSAQAFKTAGSSGLKLVNNTLVGGKDPIGIYTDKRSQLGCADGSLQSCPAEPSSRDTVRPADPGLDWTPRLDLSLDNIIAYPELRQYCGATITPICITLTNTYDVTSTTTNTVAVSLQTILHHADSIRPQTRMDGDVFANGSGKLIETEPTAYASLSAFTSVMAGSPVDLDGLEANAKSGNNWVNPDGSPTAALAAVQDQAVATPTDANINQYLPAGTKHYGVTYR